MGTKKLSSFTCTYLNHSEMGPPFVVSGAWNRLNTEMSQNNGLLKLIVIFSH